MAEKSGQTRLCPFCMEEVSAEATRCKHCRSFLQPEKPAHGGTCPFCKEAIKPDAIKCKHCGSFLGAGLVAGLSGRSGPAAGRRRAVGEPGNIRRLGPRATAWPSSPVPFDAELVRCETTEEDYGVYKLIWEDCLYLVPLETIGPDGLPAIEYIEVWWPSGPPTMVWIEPGLKKPDGFGVKVPVFR